MTLYVDVEKAAAILEDAMRTAHKTDALALDVLVADRKLALMMEVNTKVGPIAEALDELCKQLFKEGSSVPKAL